MKQHSMDGRKTKIFTAVLAAAALATAASMVPMTTPANAGGPVPVYVGGEADLDACGTIIGVAGLSATGDGFLALRTGPGTSYPMIRKLLPGAELWFCAQKGRWYGVVVRPHGNGQCGVGSPIARRQPYNGPCLSGWVYGKYTTPLAG